MKLSELKRIVRAFPENGRIEDPTWRNAYLRSLGLEPGKIYQELEMDSRYVDSHRDVSDISSQVNLHSHGFYELLYCHKCDQVEYLVGAERYRLREGDILMLPPGVSHRPLLLDGMRQNYIRDVIWLSQEFMDMLQRLFTGQMASVQLDQVLLRTAGTRWTELADWFSRSVQIAEEGGEEQEILLMGNTLTLMGKMYQASRDQAARPMRAEKPELLDQVLAYVEENLSGKITLGDAARRCYVSESTISQLFRRKMGVSFYRCVTQRRLISAKTLILRGLALENVSTAVGFSDYSAFYRAFRQEYGISPRQYRSMQDPMSRTAE